MKTRNFLLLTGSVLLACAMPVAAQVDEDAAKEYKGKADAEQQIIKHMTVSKKVKLDDGTEEDHKVVETKDPKALGNLARWILSH